MTDATKTTTLNQDTINDLRELLREAESVLANSDQASGEKLDAVRDRLRTALAEGRAAVDRLRETARRQADQLDAQVRSHPYESVGIAAAAGAFLGIVLGRLFR